MGDARGVGGENRAANLPIHSSVSFAGPVWTEVLITPLWLCGHQYMPPHKAQAYASLCTWSHFVELALSLKVFQWGHMFIRMGTPLLQWPSNVSLSLQWWLKPISWVDKKSSPELWFYRLDELGITKFVYAVCCVVDGSSGDRRVGDKDTLYTLVCSNCHRNSGYRAGLSSSSCLVLSEAVQCNRSA